MTDSRTLVLVTSLFLGASTACGSNVIADGGGGSGAGEGAAGGLSDGGADGACDPYDDAPPQAGVTIRIRNNSGITAYLPSTCGHIELDLQSSPPDERDYWYDDSCLQTCEDLQQSGPIDCGACAPGLYALETGATVDLQWDGRGLQGGVAMTPACFWDPAFGDGSCAQRVAAEPSAYVISAMAYSQCENGSAVCGCDADTKECFGSGTGQTANAEIAQFQYPGVDLVEVVFESCAFGCPAD